MKKSLILAALLILLAAAGAWAYRPLQGIALPPDGNAPIAIQGVSSSLQDEQEATKNLIWDTTIALKNISTRPVRTVDLEVTMADIQGYVITKLNRTFPVNLAPAAGTSQRLRELYLAWPGAMTAVKVIAVIYEDGSRWPENAQVPSATAPPPPSLQTPPAVLAVPANPK